MPRFPHAHVPAVVLALAALGAPLTGCRSGGAPITAAAPFRDTFDGAALGSDWRTDAPSAYRVSGGQLRAAGAYNYPLWLTRPLPDDVRIELDVTATSAAGDIKVELFGDGRSHAKDRGAYMSTGYVCVFGGWSNSTSIIARLDEHGGDRKARTDQRVEPGRRYHWTIVRKGNRVDWSIDGQPFLAYDDPFPLRGEGHRHFAFNNWESEVTVDGVEIHAE